LGQHNFSSEKQIELLHVLNFALYKKQYPQDTCGILERKIKLLELTKHETPEQDNQEQSSRRRTQKVTTDVLLFILQKSGITALSDDKAKIARLISYLTDFSEEKIRQRLSNPDELTSYHRKEVETINKILTDLNLNISLNYNKQR